MRLHLVPSYPRRVWAALLATAVGLLPLGAASAEASAPVDPGVSSWTVTPTADGWSVTYQADETLPMGGAAYTVRSGGQVLAPAREDGRAAVARLEEPPPPVAELELWRGDERVDVDTVAPTRPRSAPAAVEPPAPPATVDPGVPGPYATTRRSYELPGVEWPEYVAPIEVLGEMTLPTGAPGARPVVLVLHGRHATCFRGGPEGEAEGDWPCPAGWAPIPSHLGYRRIADLLASQGNVVVSVAANGVNGQDGVTEDGGAAARSMLVRHHLALLARWSASGDDPWGDLRGRLDLSNVVLIGHSRGGEGVARAAIDSAPDDPWRIRGLVLIAPTAFGAQAPAYVHVAVLLPYCDGDVSDLEGQRYVDGARDLFPGSDHALRSAVMVYGADHNFFNAEWTPGLASAPASDDWLPPKEGDTSWCSPAGGHRLKPAEQQQVGATYSAALVGLATGGDPKMLALLDSGASGPPSTGNAMVRATAIGGDRTTLWTAASDRAPRGSGVSVAFCDGVQPPPDAHCGPGAPHWPDGGLGLTLPALSVHRLSWGILAATRLSLPGPTDVSRARRIEVRMAVDAASGPVQAVLVAVDRSGRRALLPGPAQWLTAGPGRPEVRKSWARAVRGGLLGVTGVDLRRIVAVEVVTIGAGTGYVFDASAVGERVPAVEPTFPPVLDVGVTEVNEGDDVGRPRVDSVRATVRGAVRAPARYLVSVPGEGNATRWETVTIRPGATTVDVPVRWSDDLHADGDRLLAVTAFALQGGVTGNYQGGVRVIDDDPNPVLTVLTPTPSGTEATGITLRFALSVPAKEPLEVIGAFTEPPVAGHELDAMDVTEATWDAWGGEVRRAGEPLSRVLDKFVTVAVIPAGRTEWEVTIPFEQDGLAEGTEVFHLEIFSGGEALAIDGIVTD